LEEVFDRENHQDSIKQWTTGNEGMVEVLGMMESKKKGKSHNDNRGLYLFFIR
jgi:hypothetical protein